MDRKVNVSSLDGGTISKVKGKERVGKAQDASAVGKFVLLQGGLRIYEDF